LFFYRSPVPAEWFSLNEFHFARGRAVAQPRRIPEQRAHDGGCQLAVLPFDVYPEAAARTQPFDAARRPCLRQRRQQFDLTRMALHEHLGYSRSAAEIAVDLEWRMRVEHIGVGAFGADKHVDDVVSRLRGLQTRTP